VLLEAEDLDAAGEAASFISWMQSKTALSTRFTIEVRTTPGAWSYWSESTPIASFLSSRPASNTPSRSSRGVIDDVGALVILGERELLALGRVLERGAGGPAYLAITFAPGRTACTPAR